MEFVFLNLKRLADEIECDFGRCITIRIHRQTLQFYYKHIILEEINALCIVIS